MKKKLFFDAILKFILGVFVTGLLVFGFAGTFDFFGGWLLMGVMFVPMFFAGLVMLVKNPLLLQKRLKMDEKQKEQKVVVVCAGIVFLLGFAISGLNRRFEWYTIPESVSLVACGVFLVMYLLYALVLYQNTYLSRTVEVQENQRVIDTGLYSVVRHPMYSVTIFLFLSVPLILGSIYAFFVFLLYPCVIAVRIKHEEKYLEENLAGYKEYKNKVKYRILPYIW